MDEETVRRLEHAIEENRAAIAANTKAIDQLDLTLTRLLVLFDALGRAARQSWPDSVEGGGEALHAL